MTFRHLYLWGWPLSLWVAPKVVAWGQGVDSTAQLTPFFCPLHLLTQWICPTCGLGRSLVAAWSGQYTLAWKYHFLGPILLGVTGVVWLALLFRRQQDLSRAAKRWTQIPPRPTILLVTAYCIWGFYRNV